ncbi:trypsin-like peptidase domain-containing protein [Sporosarcina sp. CAU 1771]
MRELKKFTMLFSILFILFLPLTKTEAASNFTDVHHYQDEIGYLVNKEIIKGYHDRTFAPLKSVTNAHVAVMMVRTLQLDTANISNPGFSDVPTTHLYYKEIAAATQSGLFAKGQFFNPEKASTRGGMARAIVAGLNLKGDTTISFSDVYSTNINREYISILADNNITTGYTDGTFKPNDPLSRAHFAVFLSRALNDEFRPIPSTTLTTSQINELHDNKIVTIYTEHAQSTGQGSGILIGEGLVLTNEHVIDQMKNGVVRFNNGDIVDIAGIVRMDKNKDLALIKLAKNIQMESVTFRPFNQLTKGEKVVAIGSPLGYSNTISEGIISALHREMNGVNMIQTTASIDSGSSGGGLFDQQGRLIGVTTGGRKDSVANINFAVSVSELNDWDSIISSSYNNIPILNNKPSIPDTNYSSELFRNVKMGMTKSQVKSVETARLINETSTSLLYADTSYRGFPVDVYYTFDRYGLSSIFITFLGTTTFTLEELELLFEYVLYEMEEEIGLADYLDTNWLDDDNGYDLIAHWYSPVKASWRIHMTYDYKENASILIMSDNN